jgi:hypothetical protein
MTEEQICGNGNRLEFSFPGPEFTATAVNDGLGISLPVPVLLNPPRPKDWPLPRFAHVITYRIPER